MSTYLRSAPARHRWGVSVIEEFRPDGSIAHRVWERPSVRPEPAVRLERVITDTNWAEIAGWLLLAFAVICGYLIGWAS